MDFSYAVHMICDPHGRHIGIIIQHIVTFPEICLPVHCKTIYPTGHEENQGLLIEQMQMCTGI